ncbi:MAG: ATP-binding protein [Chthonomonadaceae bacterium]|nr:ATP-binding protein [Chthonomonadaceae bacterium]
MIESDWWSEVRSVSYDLAPKVQLVGAGRSKADHAETFISLWEFLHRHLLRLGLIASIQKTGWLKLNGRSDYLQAFWETWKDSEGPYRFDQRLGILFFSALNQHSPRARDLVKVHVGEVPYLGTGLFQREKLEDEFVESEGFAIAPKEAHDWFFQGGGFDLASCCDLSSVPSELAERCIREVDGYLKSDSMPASLKPNDRLKEIHVHDPECSGGRYLTAMFNQLVSASLENTNEKASTGLVTSILLTNLSGLESDLVSLQEARFRLAMATFSTISWNGPSSLPDIRDVLKNGRPMSGVGHRRQLEEGPKVELKAAFEWNVKKKEKSSDLRHGTLKTVAAFLNSQGGTIYLGIDDSGEISGLDEELAQLRDDHPEDMFENRLREFMKNHLDPLPLNAVRIDFPNIRGKTVCQIDVDARPGVTYLLRKGHDGRPIEEVYVRDGNRTLNLTGRMRDQFVLGRSF